mgnify:CR=1 FL=1
MKLKTAFAIIVITIILASVVATTPTVYAARYNFVLEATGQARDRYGNIHTVNLLLIGTGYGSPTSYLRLYVSDGIVDVEGYEICDVIGGWGLCIERYDYMYLYFRMTALYGWRATACSMRGSTGLYYGNEIYFTVYCRYMTLPTYPRTILYNVRLTGEIILS